MYEPSIGFQILGRAAPLLIKNNTNFATGGGANTVRIDMFYDYTHLGKCQEQYLPAKVWVQQHSSLIFII